MTKKILSCLLVLAMLVSVLPVSNTVHAEAADSGLHTHTDAHSCSEQCSGGTITWTPWGKTNGNATSLPAVSGHYCLESNITLSDRITLAAELDVTICLNGYTITVTGGSTNPYIFGSLTISDCTAHYDDAGNYISGRITGSVNTNGGLFNVRPGGKVVLESGTISGNRGSGGGGGAISLAGGSPGGKFYMYGGEICGNQNGNGGGIVANNGGQIFLHGGRIFDNTASKGNAIYIAGANSRLTVSGAPYVDQVYFDNDSNPGLQVNGLTAGAKLNIQTKTTTLAVDKLVQVASGGAQTDWDCHWLTANGKSVSRIDGAFRFGHFHGTQEYTARTGTSLPTGAVAGKMNYYYLAEDIHRLTNQATAELTNQVTICLNGHEIIHNNPKAVIYNITKGALVLEDGWAHTDQNGVYRAGGVTYGASSASTVTNGSVFSINGGSFTLKEGRIHGFNGATAPVYAVGGSVTINGGVFCDNTTSGTGGALYAKENVTFTMTDGLFENNRSTANQAGGIYLLRSNAKITGGQFVSNYAKKDAASLYLHTCTGSMSGVTFRGNTSDTSGSGFGVSGASDLTISNVTVTGNKKGNGTVLIQGSAKVQLSDSQIFGNQVSRGGGIYLTGTSQLTLTNVTITDNSASLVGGGLFWDNSDSKLTVSGSTKIIGNTCGDADQNLFMNNASQLLEVAELTGSRSIGISNRTGYASSAMASDFSGSFFSDDQNNAVLFRDNRLYIGSAHSHCLHGETGCSHTQEDWNKWSSANALPTDSGSYYLTQNVTLSSTWLVNKDIQLCLNGYSITKTGDTNARAINIQPGGQLSISDCQDTGFITGGTGITISRGAEGKSTPVLNLYGGKLTGFSASEGVIYIQSGQINAPGGIFHMYGGEITENTVKEGGIVCVKGEESLQNRGIAASFHMHGGTISKNTLTVTGGAVYATCGAQVSLENAQLTGNITAGQGGGLFLNKGASLTAKNSTIQNNQSTKDGGGMYLHSVTATLENCIITGNQSKTSGGGIGFGGTSTGSLTNCQLSDNHSPNGGALLIQGSSQVTLDSTQIENNTANIGGGIFLNKNSVLTVQGGTTIAENAATKRGGGIFAENDSTLVLAACQVSNNQDGGVYVSSAAKLTLSQAPSVLGNQNGNLILVDGVLLQAQALTDGASLAVTGNPGPISTDCDDFHSYFVSDSPFHQVQYLEGALHLVLMDQYDHKHCLCNSTSSHCDHTQLQWSPWNKTDTLPTSGCYYLLEDVVLTEEVSISSELTLCLNGHTVTAAKDKRLLSTPKNVQAVITISDCAGTGKLTGGVDVANNTGGGAIFIRAKGTLNLYGGQISGNKSITAGGGILLADSAAMNLYGGQISENGAKDEDAFIDGAGIYCMDNSILNIYGGSIRNNSGRNGGGIYCGGQLTIAGGEICGNTATQQGGGVYARTGDLLLQGGKLENNSAVKDGGGLYYASGKATISGGYIAGNESKASSGGLSFSKNAQVTITDVTVTDNKAPNGAGMVVQGSASLELKGGKFTNNIATSNGGGIFVNTNCALLMTGGTVSGNQASGFGGGIYATGAKIDITGGLIEGNTSVKDGGGFYCRSASVTNLGGSLVVRGNQSTKGAGGGAVYTGRSTGKISGGTFEKNKAPNAGGLIVQGYASVEVTNITVRNNTATNSGGGIYVNNSTFKISDGKVSGNRAEKSQGGGMFCYGSEITITGGSFTGNVSEKDGGGVYNSAGTLRLVYATISGNQTMKGAGGGLGATKEGRIIMTGGNITYNKAVANAAGIIIQNKAHLELYGGTIAYNEGVQGSGVYVNNASADLMCATIRGNKATGNGGGGYTYNSDIKVGKDLLVTENYSKRYAGGLYFNKGTLDLEGALFTNNESVMGGTAFYTFQTVATIKDPVVRGNKATNSTGGGVCLSRETEFQWTGGLIEDNYASHGAAGLLVQNWAKGTVTGLTIRNNEAGTGGGGLFCYTCVDAEFNDCQIYGNSTGGGGAGVFLSSPLSAFDPLSYITLNNCKIYDNKSGDMGAGVYISKQIVSTWNNCQIENNISGTNGGGMYTLAGSSTTLNNILITGNQSAATGSAIVIGDNFTMHNVTITGNKAAQGAAVVFPSNQFDGESFQLGHYTMSGDLIITDNEGTQDDLYVAAGTAIGTTAEGFGPNTKIHVELEEGILTNTILAAYHYEGGDLHYVITSGDRSLTEPEVYVPAADPEQTDPTETSQTAEAPAGDDNTLLYVGIGGIAAVVIAAAVILVIVKKKKAGKATQE